MGRNTDSKRLKDWIKNTKATQIATLFRLWYNNNTLLLTNQIPEFNLTQIFIFHEFPKFQERYMSLFPWQQNLILMQAEISLMLCPVLMSFSLQERRNPSFGLAEGALQNSCGHGKFTCWIYCTFKNYVRSFH